jgi:hypothetical protein
MRPNQVDLPALAFYKSRDEWVPQYGDYLVWSRWFSTWHGLIINYNGDDLLDVIWAGVPYLLFTLSQKEQQNATKQISLSKIKRSKNGAYAIQQFNPKSSGYIWYI